MMESNRNDDEVGFEKTADDYSYDGNGLKLTSVTVFCRNGVESERGLDNIREENSCREIEDNGSDASTIIEDYCDNFNGQNNADDDDDDDNPNYATDRDLAETGDYCSQNVRLDGDINGPYNLPSYKERNLDLSNNCLNKEASLKFTIKLVGRRKDGVGDDFLNPDFRPKRQRGRPPKNWKKIPKASIMKLNNIDTREHIESDKSTKRPRGRPPKNRAKREHTTDSNLAIMSEKMRDGVETEQFESIVQEESNFGGFPTSQISPQTLEKSYNRRGRGRPKSRGRILNSSARYTGRPESERGDSCEDDLNDSVNGLKRKSRFSDSTERRRGNRARGRPRGRGPGGRERNGGGQGTDESRRIGNHSRCVKSDAVAGTDGDATKKEISDEAASTAPKAIEHGMKFRDFSMPKIFPCNHCQKHFKMQMSLNQHLKCAHGASPPLVQPSMWFFQRQCHAVADAFAALSGAPEIPLSDDGHVEKCSTEESEEKSLSSKVKIRCQTCDGVFRTYYSLLVHSRAHTGERLYRCEICDEQFITRGHLTLHYRTHDLELVEKLDLDAPSIEIEKDPRDREGEGMLTAFPDLNLSDLNLESADSIILDLPNSDESTVKIENQIEKTEFEDVKYGLRYKTVKRLLSGRSRRKNASISCPVCEKAFTTKYSLVIHSRIHTGEKPYACDACSLRFYTKGHLVSHRRTHTGEKPYRCKDCGRSFSASNPLRRHELSFHSTLRPYVCEFCAFTFKFKDHLRLHIMRRHGEKKQVKCKFCDAMFTDRKLASRHERCKHRPKPDKADETTPEKRFRCRFCDLAFESTVLVKQHKAEAHAAEIDRAFAELHKCPVCDKTYSWRAGLRAHLTIHSGERRFECTICGKRFFHPNVLRRHSVTHSEARPFSCGVCGRRFKSKGVMVKHEIRFHFGEKQFSCELCGNQFFTATELKTHKSFVHTDEKSFVCEICDARVKTRMSLKQHMLCHGEKKFACEICGKQFFTQQNMRRHLRLHSDDTRKPFSCHLCGKQFRTKKYLVRHLSTHDEKKYSCDLCPKRFFCETDKNLHEAVHDGQFRCKFCGRVCATTEELDSHEKIHSGDRPFECAVCHDRFAHKKSLCRHLTLHTGERQYDCKLCGKQFTVKCHLTKHLRNDCESKKYTCCVCNKRYAESQDLMIHYRNCRTKRSTNAVATIADNTDVKPLIGDVLATDIEVFEKLDAFFVGT